MSANTTANAANSIASKDAGTPAPGGVAAQSSREAVRSLVRRRLPTYAWATAWLLLFSDALVLAISAVAGASIGCAISSTADLEHYIPLWPLLGVFLAAFAAVKLYPAVAISPPEEFRRQSLVLTLVVISLATTSALLQNTPHHSTPILFLVWSIALVLLPAGRSAVRRMFAARRWYGSSAIVLGSGEPAAMLLRTLKSQPEIGLKPVVLLDDRSDAPDTVEGVPVANGIELSPLLSENHRIPYALVITAGLLPEQLQGIVTSHLRHFRHIVLIPDFPAVSTLWVTSRDMGGLLGLELEQRLLDPGRRVLKWFVEMLVLLVLGLPMLLAGILIAALVRLDSSGPIFVGPMRVGKGGRAFKQWKFRTMVDDADSLLEAYLAKDPALREEWEQTHKLRHDPRLTRVGRFLRRTSLDELPQVFNVLLGQMSLVGPRPITAEEVERYGGQFPLYTRVRPGISGLWQISGRSDLPYPERVKLDAYYVLNWSVWLDLYILTRTVWIVLAGRGAY